MIDSLGPLVSDRVRDPHGWNTWENYKHLHETRLEQHPFVVGDSLQWERRDFPEIVISVAGNISCANDVSVHVRKELRTRFVHGNVLEVRGDRYSYNAFYNNLHKILRYDNGHANPDEFHRHEFDVMTGVEQRNILPRHQVPTLDDFLSEVARMVGFDLGDFR